MPNHRNGSIVPGRHLDILAYLIECQGVYCHARDIAAATGHTLNNIRIALCWLADRQFIIRRKEAYTADSLTDSGTPIWSAMRIFERISDRGRMLYDVEEQLRGLKNPPVRLGFLGEEGRLLKAAYAMTEITPRRGKPLPNVHLVYGPAKRVGAKLVTTHWLKYTEGTSRWSDIPIVELLPEATSAAALIVPHITYCRR